MDNSLTPIGPGFKKTDLKAGMRIKFLYQDQQYTGTIDGFNVIEGQEYLFVDGIPYRYSDFDLRPVYEVLAEVKPVKKEIKKEIKPKKIAGKPAFKLVKKLRKK